jgi:lipopolysaccharide/colanic/teichoic acid biosynthesis glycosyltransferase
LPFDTHPSSAGRLVVRLFDIVVAGLALTAALPVLVVIALLVKASSPGPVIYGSWRLSAGPAGRFQAWKFRSMYTDAESRLANLLETDPELRATYERYSKLSRDPRVTPFGRWLRLLSLDELPQLWNVLGGEMSIVGPRPKLPHEQAAYGDLFEVVCRVKPGLTGLWQVSGRSALDFEQRIVLDVRYALTRTLRQDLAICLRTAGQLVRPDGNSAH